MNRWPLNSTERILSISGLFIAVFLSGSTASLSLTPVFASSQWSGTVDAKSSHSESISGILYTKTTEEKGTFQFTVSNDNKINGYGQETLHFTIDGGPCQHQITYTRTFLVKSIYPKNPGDFNLWFTGLKLVDEPLPGCTDNKFPEEGILSEANLEVPAKSGTYQTKNTNSNDKSIVTITLSGKSSTPSSTPPTQKTSKGLSWQTQTSTDSNIMTTTITNNNDIAYTGIYVNVGWDASKEQGTNKVWSQHLTGPITISPHTTMTIKSNVDLSPSGHWARVFTNIWGTNFHSQELVGDWLMINR